MFTKLARWAAREPVRLRGYLVGLAVIALLVGYGVLSDELAPLWIALLSALIGAPAVESARARVTPTSSRAAAPEPGQT